MKCPSVRSGENEWCETLSPNRIDEAAEEFRYRLDVSINCCGNCKKLIYLTVTETGNKCVQISANGTIRRGKSFKADWTVRCEKPKKPKTVYKFKSRYKRSKLGTKKKIGKLIGKPKFKARYKRRRYTA